MWRLDLLESKFEETTPRFPHTKKLLFAIKYNNKLAKKLPTTKDEASLEILQLKSQFFENKYHSAYQKLNKEINKLVKQKPPPSDLFSNEDFINHLITSKLIKCITSTILISKQSKMNPPDYIPNNLREIIKDKSNLSNPSRFFINYCQNSKPVNNYCSNIWNKKNIKITLQDIDWSFKMVRGNLSKSDIAERSKQTGKDINEDEDESGEESEEEEEEDEEEEQDGEGSEQLNGKERNDQNESDIEEQYEKYATYDNLVGASDDEDEQNNNILDSNINYNEVTDEEPSDEESESDNSRDEESADSVDDFFEEEPPKKKLKNAKKEETYNLPELAQGYYSGGSDDDDDDVDNDKLVNELTHQRKNRRGQRARQKIWAQKYGKSAKHIVKDMERVKSEREKRQEEYEERQRKRELKAKLAAEKQKPTGANNEPLGERKSNPGSTVPQAEKKIHPSWEAKKQAEEKLKNVKFQGKKITFD
ncbi:BUD22 [Candida pseudojiufengensis]|uniref:BUD22 n=1 Tax=Candida pseudojiufengensis TaxID=497109 RepID=UPI0022256F42|nr:BUD22 [Candida pseudojiufengensis]KAI5966853.1 BUD22 [Candida pseudojiufengensis]